MHAWHGHDARRVPPLILGHEIVGIAKSGAFAGKRVAVNPLMTCGKCDQCQTGNEHLCYDRELLGMKVPGGFAEQVAVNESNLTEISDDLGFFDAALVALGWSQLMVSIPELKQGIQWRGAIYICYLAVQAFRQNRLSQTGVTHPEKNYFRQGLLMSLTNPKVTLFFMIFFPSFLFSKLLSTPMQLTLLGFLFWAQAQLIFTFVASLGHVYQQSQFFKVTQKYHHIIESGILLTIAIIVVFGA